MDLIEEFEKKISFVDAFNMYCGKNILLTDSENDVISSFYTSDKLEYLVHKKIAELSNLYFTYTYQKKFMPIDIQLTDKHGLNFVYKLSDIEISLLYASLKIYNKYRLNTEILLPSENIEYILNNKLKIRRTYYEDYYIFKDIITALGSLIYIKNKNILNKNIDLREVIFSYICKKYDIEIKETDSISDLLDNIDVLVFLQRKIVLDYTGSNYKVLVEQIESKIKSYNKICWVYMKCKEKN